MPAARVTALGAWSPGYMHPSGQRWVPPELVNIGLAAFEVPPALIDERVPFS
jgi:hypothetical protein